MTFSGCLVIERSQDWLIVVGDEVEQLSVDVNPDELGVCAELMSRLAGLKNPQCVLAPDSNSCFFATLSPAADIDLRDRAALAYELEDHLPIDAESTVADFALLPSADGRKKVSALAIETDRWQRIAQSIESVGLQVRSIVPRAVLATRALSESVDVDSSDELFLIDDGRCDSITLENRTIGSWQHFGLDAASLRRHRLLDRPGAEKVLVAGANPDQQATIRSVYPDAQFCDLESDVLIVDGAARSLTERTGRWFELRRGALGPSDPLRAIQKQMRLAGYAAAICLLALAVGGWWRARRIDQEIADVRAAQQQLFRDAFPGSKVPGALLRRVRSEHTKVSGSRGQTSKIDIPQSAPDVVQELVAALPDDVRFRVTSLSVLDGRVDLDLQVRSPVDAGALASSLSQAGFDVKPPGTTQKDAKTFESILKAEWIGRQEDEPTTERVAPQERATGENSPEEAGLDGAVSIEFSARREATG